MTVRVNTDFLFFKYMPRVGKINTELISVRTRPVIAEILRTQAKSRNISFSEHLRIVLLKQASNEFVDPHVREELNKVIAYTRNAYGDTASLKKRIEELEYLVTLLTAESGTDLNS